MSCFNDEFGYNLFTTNNEYGEKYQFESDFKGPKSRRSTTDVYWLVAFLAFATLWLIFCIFVLLHDPNNSLRLHENVEFFINEKSSAWSSDNTSEIFEYLKTTLWSYLSTILIATIICLILIYVMRWIATPVVWFSIFLMIALFLMAAILGFVIYNKSNSEASHNNSENNEAVGFAMGIFFSITTIITVVLVYCFRQKIVVAIALIKEGSKAVASSYSTVFFPIGPLFFQIGIFAMFSSVAVNIQFIGSRDDTGIKAAMHVLNLFGSLWAYWFIDAFKKMVFAHTFSAWYWTFEKKDLPLCLLTTAVIHTTRYHLGTVALGSLIIAIVQIICYIIRAIMNNRYMRVFNLCCNISQIVERLLQFLNKNTFIMVAIHGNPFCRSMRDAFNLLMRNIASVCVTSKVTSLQFAIFNIVIAAGMGGLTYLFLPNVHPQPELIWYPIMVSVIGSYIVAATLFDVYKMAIDTLFLCFLEDCERNDGTEQRPYYMSQTLMKVLHKDSVSLLPPPRYE